MFLSSWPATFSIVDDLLPSCLLPLHVSRLSTPRLQFLFVFHLDESRPLFRRGIRVRRCACRARVRVRQPPSVLAVWPPWEKSTNSAVRSVTPLLTSPASCSFVTSTSVASPAIMLCSGAFHGCNVRADSPRQHHDFTSWGAVVVASSSRGMGCSGLRSSEVFRELIPPWSQARAHHQGFRVDRLCCSSTLPRSSVRGLSLLVVGPSVSTSHDHVTRFADRPVFMSGGVICSVWPPLHASLPHAEHASASARTAHHHHGAASSRTDVVRLS